jgi:hypothetical protein
MKAIATLLVLGVSVTQAQPASPTKSVPIHGLSAPSASTTIPLRTVIGLRQLAGGKVLVNDPVARRLVLFDSTLTTLTVLRDSAPGTAESYGARSAIVVPYLADSVLFVDMASQTIVVIDPSGTFRRVMAPPNPRDLTFLSRPGAGVDAKGRLIYQGSQPARPAPPVPAGAPQVSQPPDSAPILRADFETRTVDTVGHIKISAGAKRVRSTDAGGRIHTTMYANPIQSVDDWALLPDGAVALIRGHDYHIDWIGADGSQSSSPKLPFDWRRLTDADKQALIDSVKAQQLVRDSISAAARAAAVANPGRAGEGRGGDGRGGEVRVGVGRTGGGDLVRVLSEVDVSGAGGSTVETVFVPLSEIVDYYPPIRSGAVRADLDGNIWILPTTTLQSKNGELVYDVVNRKGELYERVRLPEGRSLAGFGRGGVVYLQRRDPVTGYFVERTRVLR